MKILVAYYSKTGRTQGLAEEVYEKLMGLGHKVDIERIKVPRERNILSWYFLRIFKSRVEIVPPQVKDVSKYDAVCFGSPDWGRLSLPVASYIHLLKGLENKKVAIFGSTFLLPKNIFTLVSFFFDASFCREVEDRGGRISGRLFLTGKIDEKQISSNVIQERIKTFCKKIESPKSTFKEYSLQKREIESARLFLWLFLFLIVGSVFFPLQSLFSKGIFPWTEYFSLLFSSTLSAFIILVALSFRKSLTFIKYFSVFSFVLLFTLTVLLFSPNLQNSIVIEYIILFTLFSFFRDTKIILFAGGMSFMSYGFLYMFDHVYSPSFDLPVLAISITIITFVTKSLQGSHVRALEAQDETEIAQTSLEIKIDARTKELLLLSQRLEEQVEGRTRELKSKIAELERFNKLAIGRELKMIELKNRIKELEKDA